MLLSPRSKEKALARKAAYAAGALKSAETRKRKAAEAAAAAAARDSCCCGSSCGCRGRSARPGNPVSGGCCCCCRCCSHACQHVAGTPPPGGKARGSAGQGSRRGGAQGQGQGCRAKAPPWNQSALRRKNQLKALAGASRRTAWGPPWSWGTRYATPRAEWSLSGSPAPLRTRGRQLQRGLSRHRQPRQLVQPAAAAMVAQRAAPRTRLRGTWGVSSRSLLGRRLSVPPRRLRERGAPKKAQRC
jgi:hypothetical protein